MKKIFVSQSTMNLGRNRSQRDLERRLDDEIIPCPHNDYCNLRTLREKEICYLSEARRCRAYKIFGGDEIEIKSN